MGSLRAENKTVIICGVTSDIGLALAKKYSIANYNIIGTYRSTNQLSQFKCLPNCRLFKCDIMAKQDIDKFIMQFAKLGLRWSIFMSCIGLLNPIGKFFSCRFDDWSNSVHINAIEQLRILHALYKYRVGKGISNVVFFAGGGANSSVSNYSAYSVSKIMLTKMCELLDAENPDLNIFIVGPGWVKTKIHNQTLKAAERAGEIYEKTSEFMNCGAGTSMNEIYNCIEWLTRQGRKVAGGRNFSVVNDKWRGGRGSVGLIKELSKDRNMYKLRRFKNEWGANNEK